MVNRAVVVDARAPLSMAIADVPEPAPRADQAVVEVHRVSLNHGDLGDATSGRLAQGDVLGSDVAGVVLAAAADGSGPAVGDRVVGLAVGAFCGRVAIDTDDVATLPDGVDLGQAAALPVAGLAALRTLGASGPLEGRRVLVTGAAGGVGSFAVQLAAHARAHVIASVGTAERGTGLAELGVAEVVVGLDGVAGPIDVVVDSVGGPQLVAAWSMLAPGGTFNSVGWTSGEPAVLSPYATIGPPKVLRSFLNLPPFGADLATLVGHLAAGDLTVPIGLTAPLEDFAAAAAELRARRVVGKVVLDPRPAAPAP
jgi:NADPH:quinone reductase